MRSKFFIVVGLVALLGAVVLSLNRWGSKSQIPVDEETWFVDVTDEEGEIEVGIGGGVDGDVAAVPGVSGVVEVLLGSPGFVGLDAFPGGVVERGRGPGGIVAGVELPGAIEDGGGFAEAGDHERGVRGGCLCRREKGSKKQQG